MEEQTHAMEAMETMEKNDPSAADMRQLADMRMHKIGSCPSLSGKSTLIYEVGTTEKETFFRITGNTAAGLFCKDWIPLAQITDLLANGSITSTTLKAVYQGKSSNSAGFLLAVLKAEGIVRLLEGKTHHYIAAVPEKPKKGKAGA